ncbi:hypothetical protein MKX01_019875 [Papaver californicum]|nr:hypothetical protein MKX01_019875 [Papaver californicum]
MKKNRLYIAKIENPLLEFTSNPCSISLHFHHFSETPRIGIFPYGVPEPYEKLKELNRGKGISKDSIREFILGLEIPADAKANLLELTPHTHIGVATNLPNDVDKFVDLVNGVTPYEPMIHPVCVSRNSATQPHF